MKQENESRPLFPATYDERVFVNCPFDDAYQSLLQAITFSIYWCGFMPVTSLNEDNALNNRLQKIENCIEQCRYGVHDISRVELNENGLPRFNMPFELGLFFGARRFGSKEQKMKSALIFEREQYRYQQFISDLNGVDIKAHRDEPHQAIKKVRDWLCLASRRTTIPGPAFIQKQFDLFMHDLPGITVHLGQDTDSLSFNDFCVIVEESIRRARLN